MTNTVYDGLQIDRPSPGVARIILDRPPVNALGADLRRSIVAAADQLGADPLLRCVVLAARGKVFCAGADLKERAGMSEAEVVEAVRGNRAVVQAIADIPVPTLAVIHGAALGGGLELALACDFRLAARGISVGLPECSLAIIPGAHGTQRLPRIVGQATARKWIFSAQIAASEVAHADRLIDELVDGPELEARARDWSEQVARCAPLALRAAKRALGAAQVGLEAGLAAEWQAYLDILPTADRREALAAFAEKRPPHFTGR